MEDNFKQNEQFADEIMRTVERFRSEYDMSAAAMIGVLFMCIMEMHTNTDDEEEDDSDEA